MIIHLNQDAFPAIVDEVVDVRVSQGDWIYRFSLPASWLLAFLGSTDQMTCVAQFDKYCRALMTSSQNAREKVCDASILCPC